MNALERDQHARNEPRTHITQNRETRNNGHGIHEGRSVRGELHRLLEPHIGIFGFAIHCASTRALVAPRRVPLPACEQRVGEHIMQ